MTTSGLLLWSLGLSAGSGLPADQFQAVLARFNSPAPPAYRALRRLEAGIPGSAKQGWLEAWTEYRPATGLTYEVIRESGYDYVRHKVLRRLLNAERQLIADGRPLRAPLVPGNYEFEDGGITESGLRRLLLHPVRRSDGVVRGAAFIEPGSGSVVRMEGRLTKSPSFWVRDVDVVWKFTRVGDALLPVELSSEARVRFYGRSNFRMTYDYVQIDGQPVNGAVRATFPDQR